MSGVDVDGQSVRKGAADSVRKWVGGSYPKEVDETVTRISKSGGTPLVVGRAGKALGVIYLKDIVKGGLPDRFKRLSAPMGIKTVMISSSATIRSPPPPLLLKPASMTFSPRPPLKDKLASAPQGTVVLAGHLVAMTGDGTNDALGGLRRQMSALLR